MTSYKLSMPPPGPFLRQPGALYVPKKWNKSTNQDQINNSRLTRLTRLTKKKVSSKDQQIGSEKQTNKQTNTRPYVVCTCVCVFVCVDVD